MIVNQVFDRFYVWWCPHSKKFIPFFNQLNERYQNSSTFRVRRVDCDIELHSGLCFEQEVNGFPSIFIYKDGEQIREYEGDKNIEQLIDFMESHQTAEGIAIWEEKDMLREIAYRQKQIRKNEAKRLKALKDATSTAKP